MIDGKSGFRLSCDASTKLGVSPPYRGRLYRHLMRQATCNQQCTRYQEAWMTIYLFTARDQQGSRPSDRAGGQMQFTLQPLVLLTDGLREPSGFRPIPAKIHRRKWRSDLILPLRVVDHLSHVKRGSIPSIKLFRGGNKHGDMHLTAPFVGTRIRSLAWETHQRDCHWTRLLRYKASQTTV